MAYLRTSRKGGGEHEERSVVFLVDATAASAPDSAAAAALAGARGAAAAENAAKAELTAAEAEVGKRLLNHDIQGDCGCSRAVECVRQKQPKSPSSSSWSRRRGTGVLWYHLEAVNVNVLTQ